MIFWSWAFNPNTRFAPNAAKGAEWNSDRFISPRRLRTAATATPPAISPLRWTTAGNLAVPERVEGFNITSDKGTGIGAWSDEEVFAYFAKGHALGRGTAAGPMGEAVDQSFSRMAPADIALRHLPA